MHGACLLIAVSLLSRVASWMPADQQERTLLQVGSSTSRRRQATQVAMIAGTDSCSNSTVPWPVQDGYNCESLESASKRAMAFLLANLPPWDAINRGTLEGALLPTTVQSALQVRSEFPWAASVPEEVWLDYVLPYASVNEAREDWRQLMYGALQELVKNSTSKASSLKEVAQLVNENVWEVLRPQGPIHFKEQQTPLIFDPMSTTVFGYASCTGVSILYIDALRSVGVPARIVGTPAWHGVTADGNHNWVEIWLGSGQGLQGEPWTFNEAEPAGPGEKFDNPCDKWFCNPGHFNGSTLTYAAHFNRTGFGGATFQPYPLAWDVENQNIPGVNRTSYYNALCGAC